MASWEREDKARALVQEAKRVEGPREERRLAVQAKVVKTQRVRAVRAVLADSLTAHTSGGAEGAYLKEQHGGTWPKLQPPTVGFLIYKYGGACLLSLQMGSINKTRLRT